jgi:uncharacterized protein
MRVHGDWLLTPQRAALHVPTATAVLADLHLGYDQARRRGGEAVPDFSVAEALAPLRTLAGRHRVRGLVIAGDLFEAGWHDDLVSQLVAWLGKAGLELTGFVPGNHDRGVQVEGGPLPVRPDGVRLGDWLVVHGDGDLPSGRCVLGHFHPWLRWGAVTAPCYLVGADRLVVPAFSRDALGADVLGQPRWAASRCCAIADDEVLDLGELATLRERARQHVSPTRQRGRA